MASKIYWSYHAKYIIVLDVGEKDDLDRALDEKLYNGKIWVESLTPLRNSNPIQWLVGALTTISSGNSFEHRFIYCETDSFYYSFEFTDDSCIHIRLSKKSSDIFSRRNDCDAKEFNSYVPQRTVRRAIENCEEWLGCNYDAYNHNCQDFVNYLRDCNLN